LRDYISLWMIQMEPDPGNGIYGVAPPPVVGTQRYTVFFGSRAEADAWIVTVYPSYASIFLAPSTPAQWYMILDKEKFIGWMNLVGIYNVIQLDEGVAPNNYTQIPPRDSGINSKVEKKASYGGKTGSAGSGTPSFQLSVAAYLQEIILTLRSKGRLLLATVVQNILDDLVAGKINDQQALDRLEQINFN